MKNSKYLVSMALASILITGSTSFAAGAANWNCVSSKAGLTATYEESMFGEILTTVQRRHKGSPSSITYFVNEAATPAPGSKILLQDDPNQDDLQQQAGTFPAELAEILLTEKEKIKYDRGFQFQGANFLCARD